MKTIIINDGNLKDKDIQDRMLKCRCIFLTDDGKILVEKYAGLYMLPGGKVSENENIFAAVVREVSEEIGMNIKKSNLSPFIKINHYCKDYPKKDGEKLNKLTETIYFIANIPGTIDYSNMNLSLLEKNGNLKSEIIEITELQKKLCADIIKSDKSAIFAQELMEVLINLNFEKIEVKTR